MVFGSTLQGCAIRVVTDPSNEISDLSSLAVLTVGLRSLQQLGGISPNWAGSERWGREVIGFRCPSPSYFNADSGFEKVVEVLKNALEEGDGRLFEETGTVTIC